MASSRLAMLAGIDEDETVANENEGKSRIQHILDEQEKLKLDPEIIRIEKRKNLIKVKSEKAKMNGGEDRQRVICLEEEFRNASEKQEEINEKIHAIYKISVLANDIIGCGDKEIMKALVDIAIDPVGGVLEPIRMTYSVVERFDKVEKKIIKEIENALMLTGMTEVLTVTYNIIRANEVYDRNNLEGQLDARTAVINECARIKPVLDDLIFELRCEQLEYAKKKENIENEILNMLV